jgi:hypothetical protein
MPILSKVQSGQPITAELFNNLIDSIRECQINSVVGSNGLIGTFKRGVGGTTISVGKSTPELFQGGCPFDIRVQSIADSKTNFNVRIGTINGLVPSNIEQLFEVSNIGYQYVFITCQTNGKNVVSAGIQVSSTPPTPVESTAEIAPESFKVLIAAVSGGSIYKSIPCGNITARVSPSIQEELPTYQVGKRNFKQYYNWVF